MALGGGSVSAAAASAMLLLPVTTVRHTQQEGDTVAWQTQLCFATLRAFTNFFIFVKRPAGEPASASGFCTRHFCIPLLHSEGRAEVRPGSAHREARSCRDNSALLSTRTSPHSHTRRHNSNLSAKALHFQPLRLSVSLSSCLSVSVFLRRCRAPCRRTCSALRALTRAMQTAVCGN